mgnify:CR=1 FL=1
MTTLRALFEKWGLSSLTLDMGFLQAEFTPKDVDKQAAWELYVELITRITTQELADDEGDEKTALDSVYAVFTETREIIKRHRGAIGFTKVAVVVLNKKLRPFLAKWHRVSTRGALDGKAKEFRRELAEIQPVLRSYAKMMAEMAGAAELAEAVEPMASPPPEPHR